MGAEAGDGVCVAGSVHMDVAAVAERLPGKGESVVGYRAALSPGGKAGNQAAQAARNGSTTFFIGRIGRDVFGDLLASALQGSGVDTTFLTIDEREATGVSPVLTGADGEYASIIVPGTAQRLSRDDIDAAREAFVRSAALLVQCEIPLDVTAYAAQAARSLGVRVMFNASPAPADAAAIPDDLWSAVDVLIVNTTELERLSGMPVPDATAAESAGDALRRRFGIPTVVVTLGEHGALALDAGGSRRVPAWPVPVVETIGAGDAFAGVLASELARGRGLDAALLLANAAGALAVMRPGAHDALPMRAEIAAFLRERRREGEETG